MSPVVNGANGALYREETVIVDYTNVTDAYV